MTAQQRYRKRNIATGRCGVCGQPRDRKGTTVLCRSCADRIGARMKRYMVDYRRFHKKEPVTITRSRPRPSSTK